MNSVLVQTWYAFKIQTGKSNQYLKIKNKYFSIITQNAITQKFLQHVI